MHSLLQTLLSNAFGATVLASAVWLMALLSRRPAFVRALWIVVLLKLLTPPVFTLPLDQLFVRARPAGNSGALVAEPVPVVGSISLPERLPPGPPVPRHDRIPPAALILSWASVFWFAGSTCFVLICVARAWSLSRTLRQATLADLPVQRQTAALAATLGLTRVPQVWLVPGLVCPALWALGRNPRIIIPLQLWHRLDERQRRSVLTHELAHLRRGDHWVRLLELIATIIYWWHPAVWIARRQIHDCEEQCCDAWVLWAMPASAHSYGTALLEAIDFVSTHRPTRPPLAAGLGEFRQLKRRLLMIKQGQVARALSRAGFVIICSVSALALPVGPVLGQRTSSADQPSSDQPGTQAPTSGEIAEARAHVQRLRAELREAQSRLALLERSADLGSSAVTDPTTANRGGGSTSALPGQPGVPPHIMGGGGYGGSFGGAGIDGPRVGMLPGAGGAGVGAGVPGGPGFGGGGGFGNARGGLGVHRTPEDQRLDRLEAQLRELMLQVRELKEQKDAQNGRSPQPGERPDGTSSPRLPAAP